MLRRFLERAGIEVRRKSDDYLLAHYPNDGSKSYYNIGSGSFWHPRCIDEPAVIAKILAYLQRTAPEQHQVELPLGAGAPPVQCGLI